MACCTALLGLLAGLLGILDHENTQRKHTVKKLIVLAVLALGLVAVWRKVQADRAELDLWTEATTADE